MDIKLEILTQWENSKAQHRFRTSGRTITDLKNLFVEEKLLEIKGEYSPAKRVLCGYFSIHSDDYFNPFQTVGSDPIFKGVHNEFNKFITSVKGEICLPLTLSEVLHLYRNTEYYVFTYEGLLVREANIKLIESVYLKAQNQYKKVQQIS